MIKRHALLPSSLNGLRVFEAAARYLSFTIAAQELNVTQSAVSRQIRLLEEQLGFTLFIRQHRALILTEEGKEIALILTRQFSELNNTIHQLKQHEDNTLKLNVSMSFAVRWLIPRLHSFKEQNPSLDIIISSNIGNNGNYGDQLNLDSDDYDIAISNYQDPTTIEQPVIFLRKEYLAPVYSMLLVKGDTQLTIDELLTYPRLHPTKDRSDWRAWFAQTGIQQPLGNTELTFDTLDMALTSCLSGQGATITDLLFVTNELKQGFLKLPLEAKIIDSPWKYYYYCRTKSDNVTNFVNWLIKELELETEQLLSLINQHNWHPTNK
ncbi:LysR family transcriptional regulator [Photobacterium indicum]|jgi:LysR family transcriptional regulator, glycine cleavage system transcriptional activator|uniref:LysR family transcriptional regulator n=1 Tax=Photobacterium indicum TaxID=81447 RepID=A0A2T3LF98_9GAMM|nr:LysR family transcriptional regulator [Photobacterium indicum]PSV50060.1 LysR family transcriptional regulator [Photobacterium indicum]